MSAGTGSSKGIWTGYENQPEFLKSADYQTVSCTVQEEGVEADEQGRRRVSAGSLLDAEGMVVTAADGTAVGILFHTVDVTYGCELMSIFWT